MRATGVAAVCALVLLAADASVGFSNCTMHFANGFKPVEPAGAVQICREGFLAISYDTVMVDPAWSAYYITYDDVKTSVPGRDDFYEDPDLRKLGVTQAAVDSHAFNTTWNRGHLAPSHIMSHTAASKKSCYTMANIAPQGGYFNQQPWNRLEQQLFDWILKKRSSLHIITGVAYKSRSRAVKSYGIAFPDYYWKVACDMDAGKSFGIYGNNVERGTLTGLVPVSEVEALYGGTLLPRDVCQTDQIDPLYWFTVKQPGISPH